jgi:hypothetical protein
LNEEEFNRATTEYARAIRIIARVRSLHNFLIYAQGIVGTAFVCAVLPLDHVMSFGEYLQLGAGVALVIAGALSALR